MSRWHIPLRFAAGRCLVAASLCLSLLALPSPAIDFVQPATEAARRTDAAQRASQASRTPAQARTRREGDRPRPGAFAKLGEFTVYDATLLKRKPAPTLKPMAHVVLLYEWGPHDTGLWPTGEKEGVPSRERLGRLLKPVKPGTPVVLDIERWYKDTDDEAVWQDTYAKLRASVDNLKAARPDLPVACFNAAPWGMRAALSGHKPDVEKVATQIRLLTAPGGLNEAVDFYADGVYAGRNLPVADWEKWIRWRAAELKQLDKPMHLVLNPYFSGTADQVPPEYWDTQMRVAREVASSVIVWTDTAPSFARTDHWYKSLQSR